MLETSWAAKKMRNNCAKQANSDVRDQGKKKNSPPEVRKILAQKKFPSLFSSNIVRLYFV